MAAMCKRGTTTNPLRNAFTLRRRARLSREWYYSITNVNSGKALDCVAGGVESGTNVQQYSPNGTGAQQWFLRPVTSSSGETYFQIVNVRSGLVLDVWEGNAQAGANVQIYTIKRYGCSALVFEEMDSRSRRWRLYYRVRP